MQLSKKKSQTMDNEPRFMEEVKLIYNESNVAGVEIRSNGEQE